jgi:hypothetical protein
VWPGRSPTRSVLAGFPSLSLPADVMAMVGL